MITSIETRIFSNLSGKLIHNFTVDRAFIVEEPNNILISWFSSKPEKPSIQNFRPRIFTFIFPMLLKVIDDSRWHKLSDYDAIHRMFQTIFKL